MFAWRVANMEPPAHLILRDGYSSRPSTLSGTFALGYLMNVPGLSNMLLYVVAALRRSYASVVQSFILRT